MSAAPGHHLSNGIALLIILAVNAGVIGWAGHSLLDGEPSDSVLWFAVGPLLLILALQAKAWRRSRSTFADAAVAEHEQPREP